MWLAYTAVANAGACAYAAAFALVASVELRALFGPGLRSNILFKPKPMLRELLFGRLVETLQPVNGCASSGKFRLKDLDTFYRRLKSLDLFTDQSESASLPSSRRMLFNIQSDNRMR